MPKYISGRSKLTPQSELRSNRYRYLSIENAEPNLGDPLVGVSSVTGKPVPPGQQFIVVSVDGSEPGERYWIPNQGGIIPGSISVFDDDVLVGALSSITQLNFVGAAITASVSIASSNLATIRVFSPGNNQEIIFNTANEFSTSTKLKFDSSNGLLTAGDRIIVGVGGTVITTTGVGSVGIGTTNPTQELHLQGDLRLTGTIYDSINQPGNNTELLVKNNFGGLTWVDQNTIRAGAGGTYTNIQFHNNAGLVDGAPNFVFDDINSRIGIGSTQPKVLLDVLGISSFKGGTTIDNLNVTGVTTTHNLTVTGISTVGFVTGTSAFFTGIVTATKFVGELNVSQLYVTGVSTFLQKVNINSNLGVTGLTTTQNLQVYQSTTLNRLNATGVSTFTTIDINGGEIDVTRIGTQNLNVSGISTFSSQVNINNLNVTGVGTFDNIKIYDNNIETTIGNLIIDSDAGTTQINDVVYVTDTTQSISKDTGSIVTEGGVGIERDLYVGGEVNLATSGGITTTGGDFYVNGNLYVSDDIFYDELFARNGYFTGIVSTKDLNVTGIATIATLGVSGLTTTRNLRVIGVGTFDGLLDANAGATIDNIQIGISGDNEIDTSSGNLILDSAGGTITLDDNVSISGNLIVSGISTFNGDVDLGNATSDTVTFTARVDSSILPSTNGTLNLGGTSNKWNNVYANTFVGTITGNADTATKLQTPRNIDIDGDVIGVGIGTTFDGSRNVTIPTVLSTTGVTAGTYGSSTQVGIVTVDSKGRITSASNIGINFSTATVAQSDTIKTVRSSSTLLYPTFVDSDNNPADYESLYTDAGITYNASVNLLTVSNITVSGISTLNGNVILGDDNSDTISVNGSINTNVIPTGTRNLGSSSNRWDTVYANTFDGNTRVTTTDIQTGNLLVTGIATVNGFFRPSVGSGVDKGIYWVTDPGGGSGDEAFIRYYVESGENTRLHIGIKNDADDDIYLESSQVTTSSNLTVGGDLTVTGTSTFNGNVTLGDATSDTVTFTSRINSNVLPSTNGTLDLGGPSNKWNDVYANTFVGTITGNADTATRANYADNAGISTNLKGGIASQIPYQTSANTTAFIPNGTLGQLLQSNGTSAPSWVTATELTVSRASYADNAGISTNLKGGTNGSIPYQTGANETTFLADPNINGRILTWNDSTNAPIWSDPTAISVGTASSLNVTTDTSSSPRYLVLSSTLSGITTALVDSGITYTPSTNLLTVPNIRPTAIQDTSGGTGTNNYVLTANGTGGWTWKIAGTSGGSAAIGGITIQEDGSTVGNQLGITTVNFVGASVTATSPSAGTANIAVTAVSNVTVSQSGYGCANPITVSSGVITISSSSNAYGTRYIQTYTPTTEGCDGDVWYQIT